MAGKPDSDENSFSKNDPRYWEKVVYLPTKRLNGRTYEAKLYHVRIQHQKRRREFSTDSASRREAGKKALEIYLFLRVNGWYQTIQRYCGGNGCFSPGNLSVGEFLHLVEERSHLSPQTFYSYTVKFRRIVADVAKVKLPAGVSKKDYVNGGAEKFRSLVDQVPLSRLTPDLIHAWKMDYVKAAGHDPRALAKARHTVNSNIRCSKALFAPRILKRLRDVELPDPLPFSEVEFEKQGSMRYRSQIDPEALFIAARSELFEAKPDDEVVQFKGKAISQADRTPYFQRIREERAKSKRESFKILLLSLCAGLRRNEIDKLQWTQLLFDEQVIRIEATDCFAPKADSSGDVPIDPEIMEFFCDLAAESSSRFVIDGLEPKPEAVYKHYRADRHHKTLIAWLRSKGVNSNCPIHTLRKEFGSILCREAGIFVASRLLRHSNLAITEKHYLHNDTRAVTGLGALLRRH